MTLLRNVFLQTHKPIMEKRRRARINHCLNEIKTLILEAMKKDVSARKSSPIIYPAIEILFLQPARHSKLEKADILEMAVKHLQNVQRQQLAMAIATDPSVLRKFKSGFNECADEINNYVSQLEGVDKSLKQRINTHLSKCMSGIEQVVQFTVPGFSGLPFLANSGLFSAPKSPGDQNNNPRIISHQGLQLIPSRLPTGEFALLLPNSGNLPFLSSVSAQASSPQQQPATQQIRPSAFVTVVPSTITSNSLRSPSPAKSPGISSGNDDVVLVSHTYRRTPSPQGFRPVQSHHKSAFITTTAFSKPETLYQVPQISSTSLEKAASSSQQPELKSMRFPIHNYHEKDKKQMSPKKSNTGEPLCIITNQSERYKQAQTKLDSVNYEENVPYGVKRKLSDQGLLAVATPDFLQPLQKRFKQEYDAHPFALGVGGFRKVETVDLRQESAITGAVKGEMEPNASSSSSSSSGEQRSVETNDMWRPW